MPGAQRLANSLGSSQNLALSRLWSAQKCVLVEGKDLKLLHAVQRTLYPLTDAPFETLPSYPIGGWGGWERAVGSSLLLKNAAGDEIKVYCVLDSDYHSESGIAQRYQQAVDRGVRLHIWKRKEIENYLLDAGVIHRVIAGRMPGCTLSIEQVEARMLQEAEALKNNVLDAMADAYLALARDGAAGNANRKARARVDEAWRTKAGRLAIVSGKDLVSRMSAWVQETMGVSFGAGTLASAMFAHEVPQELAAVVRSIESRASMPGDAGAAAPATPPRPR